MKLRMTATSVAIAGTMMLLTACVPQAPGVPTVPTTSTTTTSTTTTSTTTTTTTPRNLQASTQIACGKGIKGEPLVAEQYFTSHVTNGKIYLNVKKSASFSTFYDDGTQYNKIRPAFLNLNQDTLIGSSATDFFNFNVEFPYVMSDPEQTLEGNTTTVSFDITISNGQIKVSMFFGQRGLSVERNQITAYADTSGLVYADIYSNSAEAFSSFEKYYGSSTPSIALTSSNQVVPEGWQLSERRLYGQNIDSAPGEYSVSNYEAKPMTADSTRIGCQAQGKLN